MARVKAKVVKVPVRWVCLLGEQWAPSPCFSVLSEYRGYGPVLGWGGRLRPVLVLENLGYCFCSQHIHPFSALVYCEGGVFHQGVMEFVAWGAFGLCTELSGNVDWVWLPPPSLQGSLPVTEELHVITFTIDYCYQGLKCQLQVWGPLLGGRQCFYQLGRLKVVWHIGNAISSQGILM